MNSTHAASSGAFKFNDRGQKLSRLAKNKSVSERVEGVNEKFVFPGDIRGSFHFRNNSLVWSIADLLKYPAGERRSDYAFDLKGFIYSDLTFGKM